MGRDQCGVAFAAHQLDELAEHSIGGVLVEIAGRLVRQHQLRLVGERARDRDTLLLAARKLARTMVEPRAQAQRAEQFARPRLRLFARLAGDQLRQDHVLFGAEIGQQVVELVDEAEIVAAQFGALAGRQLARLDAGDLDPAAKTALEQADRLQHRRLARARRPQQSDDLAGPDFKVHPAQHLDRHPALLKAAGEICQPDDRVTHSAAPRPDRCSPPCAQDTASRGS